MLLLEGTGAGGFAPARALEDEQVMAESRNSNTTCERDAGNRSLFVNRQQDRLSKASAVDGVIQFLNFVMPGWEIVLGWYLEPGMHTSCLCDCR